MPHKVDHHAILERNGGRNAFAFIDPARTAHLVIDMQRGFMDPGAPVEVPEARTVVDNINRISAAVRDGGGLNVFVQYTTPAANAPPWPVFMERLGVGADVHRAAFTRDAELWQLWPGLDVQEGDLRVEKCRFSAFTPGASDLNSVLRKGGIDNVIISGTLTNCCCESTARDAMQLNYRVLFIADANAALSDEAHAATLGSMALAFADLYSTDEIVDLMQIKVPA
jgi:ureidoacrylate peracid hydrolase